MQLEIGVCLNPNDTRRIGTKPRRGQLIAGQIDLKRLRFAHPQIARRIVWIGFRVDPALLIERQPRDVAGGAANAVENALTVQDRGLNLGIARNRAPGT